MARYTLKIPTTGFLEVTVDGDTPEEAFANYNEATGYDFEKDQYHDYQIDDTYEALGRYDDNGNFEEL